MDPTVLAAIIGLGGLGLIFGGILAVASKKLAVKVDPRVDEVLEALPGINCGACGFPGCSGYAETVVAGNTETNLCIPGGPEVAQEVAAIMGLEAAEVESRVAVTQCKGGKKEAKLKYVYYGIEDCNAAVLIAEGPKACVYGCMGLGTCARACPFEAIVMSDKGLPVVLEDKCTGCGICVTTCPKGIMGLVPRLQKVFVGCVSHHRGRKVKEVCSVGCTGCTLCANPKTTPSGVVHMEDNLPVVPSDWSDWETAVKKCPTQSFVVRDTQE